MTAPAINTPRAIIFDALQDAGLLQEGDEPTSEQFASCFRRLRDIIAFSLTQGLKLWTNKEITIPLTASQATYTIGTGGMITSSRPLRVLEAYYLTSSTGVRRPLRQLSWREITQLQTSTSIPGPVIGYFVDKQPQMLAITLWPAPGASEASNGVVVVLVQDRVTTIEQLNDTVQFPEEWRLYLRWALADDICTGQPQAIMDRCRERALMYRMALEEWDVEDAPVTFSPDIQHAYGHSRFA